MEEHFTNRATEASSSAASVKVKHLESEGPTASEMMGPALEVKHPQLTKRVIQFCGKTVGQLGQWGGGKRRTAG